MTADEKREAVNRQDAAAEGCNPRLARVGSKNLYDRGLSVRPLLLF